MLQVGSTVGLGFSCFGLSKFSSRQYSIVDGVPSERVEFTSCESLVPGMVFPSKVVQAKAASTI